MSATFSMATAVFQILNLLIILIPVVLAVYAVFLLKSIKEANQTIAKTLGAILELLEKRKDNQND